MRHQILSSVAVIGALSAATLSGACQRQEDPAAVPPPALTAEALHETNRPMTVQGCLKAGEAADTFVLAAARAHGAAETTTYELITRHDPQLRDSMREQIGQLVQVDGTLRTQQDVMTHTPATPAETGNDRPTGTAGEPMVQTRTHVQISELTAESMTPLGEACPTGM